MRTAPLLVFVSGAVFAFAACSSSSDSSSSCTCSVSVNGEKKDMTCGQSACVGGYSYTCSDGSASRAGEACASSSSSGSSSSGSSSSSSGATSSSSSSSSGTAVNACSDLATFCETKCKSSSVVYADCTKAASAGNGTKCVAWQATNGDLCN